MQAAWFNGEVTRAMELQSLLMPLHSAMFCETSPGPVKYAAELLGLASSLSRLPICEISDISKQKVESAMKDLNLLS